MVGNGELANLPSPPFLSTETMTISVISLCLGTQLTRPIGIE